DKIDAITPMERQKYMLEKVLEIIDNEFEFSHFEDSAKFFKRIINQFKQMNYSGFESETFKEREEELYEIVKENVKETAEN
ncbi:MAG: V-type ATP synthase subunit A, partial [Bacteroidales bacterium]